MFADSFTDLGRRSAPRMIVAVVMMLQRLEGLLDREAVERFAFDARWKYAAIRARLARSDRSDRTIETVLEVAWGRVISTVDPDARHGHKTSARGFDG